MTAVMILSNGYQIPLSPDAVDTLAQGSTVTRTLTNGSQTEFHLRKTIDPDDPINLGLRTLDIRIVANTHSEAAETLRSLPIS